MGGLAKDEAGVIRLCRSSSSFKLLSFSRSATSPASSQNFSHSLLVEVADSGASCGDESTM